MSGTVISRRHVLTAGFGIGAAMLWGGGTGGASHANQHGSPPLSAGSGNPAGIPPESASLIEPEVRQSAGGQLRTTLRVRYAYQDIGGYRLHLRSYDGTTPGPTLRARPGDVLRIRLVSRAASCCTAIS
jgi:FtsP/CotA-like multicopper oxidase with cupredoxin domain